MQPEAVQNSMEDFLCSFFSLTGNYAISGQRKTLRGMRARARKSCADTAASGANIPPAELVVLWFDKGWLILYNDKSGFYEGKSFGKLIPWELEVILP